MARINPAEIAEAAKKPMKYFSHDSNAADDIKCRRLLRRCGMEGYGRWWRLCELLAAETGHVISVGNDEDQELLAETLMFDGTDELGAFLITLTDCELIQMTDEGGISSKRMNENSLYFGKKRASGGKGGANRGKVV